MTTDPAACATAELLLVMLTVVSAVADVGSKTIPIDIDVPIGAAICPTNGRSGRAMPTAGATTIGVWLAAGVPTITVTLRTNVPALRVRTAAPSAPDVIVSVISCSPGCTADAVAVATAGALLLTDTASAVPPVCAVDNIGTLTVNVCDA